MLMSTRMYYIFSSKSGGSFSSDAQMYFGPYLKVEDARKEAKDASSEDPVNHYYVLVLDSGFKAPQDACEVIY